ncbi:MAG: serine/threonine protein kinase [Myxococcales bacterium]|nr:serine/threonine protein kinase [Myxococcales bacterium]MCB9578628.1 serine/threonine protein kinase [Polyangiaceae bacterium]
MPADPESNRAPSGTLRLPQGDAELAQTLVAASDSEPRVVDPTPASLDGSRRYSMDRLLGQGGMGEVRLCSDSFIGREVAMKVIKKGHGSFTATRARFLREARVQGQLEHPSVVPVYDIGLAEDGQTYFTMKRVKGHTIEQILSGLRAGDEEIREEYTRRKLLSALGRVCLTIAFAHSRGVVHRDLKPANVMLGDFGEVYVLDWGVAKIQGAAELELDPDPAISGETEALPNTEVGALIGTPGYMAPEQVRGEVDHIGPAADVYALGAILFEILALEPLHRGDTLQDLLVDTLASNARSPRERAPEQDVEPELEEIVRRAVAPWPTDRYQSAREMHDAIEAFLDGERDAEQRKKAATLHIDEAERALAEAARGEPDADAKRARAMREITRALALDPSHDAAMGLLMQWVSEAPTDLPPDAEAALKEVERQDRARNAKRAALAYMCWYLLTPIVLWMGIRDWTPVLLSNVAITAVVIYSLWMGKTGRADPRYMRIGLMLNFVVVGFVSMILGPFVLLPGMASASASVAAVGIRANRMTRRFLILLSVLSVFVPAGLQLVGWLPASYAFADGQMRILPAATYLPAVPTLTFLVSAILLQVVVTQLLVGIGVERLVLAERRNFAQAWRLRHLLPADSGA